jgi:GT2 family glycosyltransferase
MQRYLEAHPHVGLVGCQFEEIDEQNRILGAGTRSRWVPGRLWPRTLRPDEYPTPFVTFFCVTGQGPFALYRRKIWERTAGWDANLSYAEDADMFCQMALLAPVHYIPARLYQKRVHPSQAMNSTNHEKIQLAHHKFRAKWANMLLNTPHQSAILKYARRHYHRRHAPFRDLKVARLLFGEWRRDGRRDAPKLRRVLELLVSAARGFAGLNSAN